MIIGIGNDMIDIRRIEETWKHGERFIRAHLHRDRDPQVRAAGPARRLLRQALRRQGGLLQGAGHRLPGGGVLEGHGGRQRALGQAHHGADGRRQGAGSTLTPAGHAVRIHLTITDDFPYAHAFVMIEAVVA